MAQSDLQSVGVLPVLAEGEMHLSRRLSWLGIGFVVFGAFVLAVAIPYAVTSPSNVTKTVLSPTFWPNIIGWLIILLGAILIAMEAAAPPIEDPEASPDQPGTTLSWVRLLATGLVMVVLVYLVQYFGLVWISMVAFVALSVIVRSSRPVLSVVVAVALPLVLYAFFNHVAGVAVPQGEFITLP
jgi:putative tricarboxylic transport membrane protein